MSKTKSPDLKNELNAIQKKLDILIVVQLAKAGLTKKEVADVLGVSGKTIERMLPFAKVSKKRVDK